MAAEGNESFQIQIRTGSISGPIVAVSSAITVVDTPATYLITQSATSVNEGSSVTFTITTTNVANGTVVYWVTAGTTDANDFNDFTITGSATISSNTATVTRTLRSDLTTEGTQNFTFRIYSDAGLTTLLAASSVVTVSDTSLTPPTLPPPTSSLPPPTSSLPPPTSSLPPPTSSLPPPTSSLPPPTSSLPPPTSSPPPTSVPAPLTGELTQGTSSGNVPSVSTNPFTILGTYGSGTRRVTFKNTSGVTVNYELYWNGSPMSQGVYDSFVVANMSGFQGRSGSLSNNISVNFFFKSDRSGSHQIGVRITASGRTPTLYQQTLPAPQVYSWSTWRAAKGLSSAVQTAADNLVEPVYNNGPWSGTRYSSMTGGTYFGLNRIPEDGGAEYWSKAAVADNWSATRTAQEIISSALAQQSSSRDRQAAVNGNQTWESGAGAGPVQDQGTP